MTAQVPQSEGYNVTERLFDYIDKLSTEKQFNLYTQLIQDRVGTELFKLIIDLSDEEKNQILEQLTEAPFKAEEKTPGELG